jgi:hypothetical protein
MSSFSAALSLTAGNTGFSVSSAQIITPTGATFLARGMNLPDWAIQSGGGGTNNGLLLQTMFPSCNCIRLNHQANSGILQDASGYNNAASAFTTFVQNYTGVNTSGLKVGTNYGVVIIEDHKYPSNPTMPTGTAAANQLTWYQEWATLYLKNPYVWYGTTNEPWGSDTAANICANQANIYNTVRSTTNNSPILLEISTQYGSNVWSVANESYFTNMTNVVWDCHVYELNNNVAVTQSVANTELATFISAAQNCGVTSKNGTLPVIIGEYGPGNFTEGTANDGVATCVAIWNDLSHSGSIAWWYQGDKPFNLVSGATPTITSYGTAVNSFMAGSPPTTFSWTAGTDY